MTSVPHSPRRAVLVLCLLAWAALEARAAVPQPCRGVWVANVGSGSLSSPEAVERLVDRAAAAGVNTLFVVTWNRGLTTYPSRVMLREFGVEIDPRYAGRDPLREVIDAAHARGLAVVAWFEFGFSSSYRKPDGGPILVQRPHWAAHDSSGRIVSKNGFQWMNPFHHEVQDFLLELVTEVVRDYEVDGVQGDDRMPAVPSVAGYSPYTAGLYRQEHGGADPPLDAADARWIAWRADRLSRFVERAHRELKAIDPELCVSWAPSVYPWSLEQYLQDWPRWLREGWGDLFCPQVYRKDVAEYRRELREIVRRQAPADKLDRVAPGILVSLAAGYDLPGESLREMVAANREHGFRGEVFFYDAGLEEHAEVFQTLYREPATR